MARGANRKGKVRDRAPGPTPAEPRTPRVDNLEELANAESMWPETAREERRAQVALLDRRGYTTDEIGRRIGVTRQTVINDLKVLKERYMESALDDVRAMIAYKLQQYRDIRREAWEAWERSKEDQTRTTSEYMIAKPDEDEKNEEPRGRGRPKKKPGEALGGFLDSMRKIREIVVKEGRIPANEFLTTILKTLEAERQLLGLDPKEKGAGVNIVNIDWKSLAAAGGGNDLIEELLRAEENRGRMIEAPKGNVVDRKALEEIGDTE